MKQLTFLSTPFPYSPVLGLNIAQNGTEINNISLEAEFHPY